MIQHSGARIVAVLGAGTMGQGIAQVAATAGFTTRLFDTLPERASQAIDAIDKQLARLVEKGKFTGDQRSSVLALLSPASNVAEASKDAELVIEAAPENLDLKTKILNEAKSTAHTDAILASNTSSLSLTELGARVGEAHRVIGLHFFNPPPVMELLEIVRGLSTSDATVDRALAIATQMKKSPIVVNDSPGFASSRLGVILGAEAIRMLESGVASAVDIDRAMELGYRHPMGPLKLTDLVGLDVRLAILDHLHREVGEQFRAPSLLRTMVRAGKLGKKSGEGFYRWKDGVAEPKPQK
ncbi:MAG: 3-hydroxyacyl-CoA dehydrogenase family protein [Polyangiaceae bacterium]